ncbi:MAG: hypothetical protein E7272_02005 [Pseudobutyrivibrio ruminis]|uniref:Uncharacterized protein n=1 Tax=Pseudobutyrivibrio ruminis TaxID=46206 RepID=A0A927UAI5_9FIRM|nr:hypothetical protein [Pseudobutyrivibrio ruminis]
MNQNVTKEINIGKIWFYILIVLIFMYGIIFPGVTYLQIDYLALGFVVISIVGAFIEKKMKFDVALLFLFQAMFVCSLKDDMWGNRYEVCYGWILVSAYIIGKLSIGNLKGKDDKRVVISYFALASGLLVTGIVDIIYNIAIGYFSTEWIVSIWTNETIGRTVYDLYGILMVSAIPYFVLQVIHKKRIAILGIIIAISYVVLMVRNEGRYCLFILLLLAPMMFCLYVYDRWDKFGENNKKIIKMTFLSFVLFVIILGVSFKFNILGLKAIYKSSYLSSGGILHNVRFKLAKEALQKMPYYLQGGYGEGLEFNAHNSWLEFGDKYGVIVFILLECFRLIVIYDALKFFIKRNNGAIRYLLLPAFIFINIYFSMEPIGFRRRLYFVIPMILFGIMKRECELSS